MNSPVTSVTGLKAYRLNNRPRDSSFGGKLVAKQFGTFSTASRHFQKSRSASPRSALLPGTDIVRPNLSGPKSANALNRCAIAR